MSHWPDIKSAQQHQLNEELNINNTNDNEKDKDKEDNNDHHSPSIRSVVNYSFKHLYFFTQEFKLTKKEKFEPVEDIIKKFDEEELRNNNNNNKDNNNKNNDDQKNVWMDADVLPVLLYYYYEMEMLLAK